MTRVLIAGLRHESNTFSAMATDVDSFRAGALYYGAAVPEHMAGTQMEVAAFMDFAKAHGWRAVTPFYADASPGGPVTETAFEHFAGVLCAAARDDGPFDAVMLSLHGAMVCEHTDDGEGELLARLRDVIGAGVCVAATLDLHANVTDRMAALADILIAYRTYPHVDQVQVATRAAELIKRALAGEIAPANSVRRGAMLEGVDHGRTTAPGPMTEVLHSADLLEAQPGVLAASVCAGFAKADIHDAGPSAIVTGDGADPRYGAMAEKLMDQVWESRLRRTVQTVPTGAAVNRAKTADSGGGPLVLADFADNPGGGGYGDATNLLRAMIEADLRDAAFATIYDPAAADICWESGPGAVVHLDLGGKIDPHYGAPIAVRGAVKALTDGRFAIQGPMYGGVRVDMGRTAVLEVGGIEIIVASGRFQVHDIMFFRHARIDVTTKRVIAVKSAQHFRAAFEPLAAEVIVVDDGGGLTSGNVKARAYAKVRRPIFPLDLD